jgi:RNA polymerase sigma-70 factor (ECF subfamily)
MQPFPVPRAQNVSVQYDDFALLETFLLDRTDRSFLALYDRHAPAMYAMAIRLMGGDADQASDVLQEAWLRAVPRLAQFRRESSLRTWLCGFVVNCSRERLRLPLFEELPEEIADRAAPRADLDVERAVRALPAGYRAIVVLHDIHGYTHREIAEALGIDEGTSKSQLSRARASLRRSLLGTVNGRV